MMDITIVGAGPAGLQLAYYLKKLEITYQVIERNTVASFFKTFPRDRKLISFNKKYSIYEDPEVNLRWDWNSLLTEDYSHNFADYSDAFYPAADELVDYLSDFAKKYALNIREKTAICSIDRASGGGFVLQTDSGEMLQSKYVVVSTGLSQEWFPDIKGIEHVTKTYATVNIDKQHYIGKRVLIIGKGNSSFELSTQLLDVTALLHLASPESVEMAWQTRHPGHVRANYSNILDAYQLKTLHGALDAHIRKIEMNKGFFHVEFEYVHADGEIETIEYDDVILCTGFKFDKTIFGSELTPSMTVNGRLPAMSSGWESTSIPGIFYNGTLTQSLDFKRSSSAFIDGFRYNARSLAHLLNARLNNTLLAHQQMPLTVENLTKYVQSRACNTSSLWTQFGSLADVICIDSDNDKVKIFQDTNMEYHHEFLSKYFPIRLTLTFEWGQYDGNVFEIQRHPSNKKSYTNIFLHPILRTYKGNDFISEHHILEDLFGMYSFETTSNTRVSISSRSPEQYHKEEHTEPLIDYLQSTMETLSKHKMTGALV